MIIGPPGAGKTTALLNAGLTLPARRRDGPERGRRRRRHAHVRLVVHRERGADRHRRPLHHAGFRRGGRQGGLARLSRPAEAHPRAPAAERRAGGDRADPTSPPRPPPNGWRMPARSVAGSRSSTSSSACACRSMRCSPRPTSSPASPSSSTTSIASGAARSGASRFPLNKTDAGTAGLFAGEFRLLVERLNQRLLDRLQAERSPERRALIAGFPAQVASLDSAARRVPHRGVRRLAARPGADAARRLSDLGHPGRHADRPADRRSGAQLRHRLSARARRCVRSRGAATSSPGCSRT